jgi:hypothetical protein
MVIGLVFIYLAILMYGALLLLLSGLVIYVSYRFQRRTTLALLGFAGWLLTAPVLGLVLFVMPDGDGPSLALSFLIGYSVCSPLFLVPLVRVLLGPSKPLGPQIHTA